MTDNLKFLQAVPFDMFKIYSQPHGAKTSNPVINLNNDETLILPDWSQTLSALGFRIRKAIYRTHILIIFV